MTSTVIATPVLFARPDMSFGRSMISRLLPSAIVWMMNGEYWLPLRMTARFIPVVTDTLLHDEPCQEIPVTFHAIVATVT